MTADELSAFRQWRALSPEHNAVFEKERKIWRALALSPTQGQALHAASMRLERKQTVKTSVYALTALAASGVFLLYAPTLTLWWQADHWTGPAISTVALADGSEAILDSDTAIAVHYTAARREISLLRGNAFFKVQHDPTRPFQVTDQNGRIEDVGTVFEVRDTPEQVSVAVTQGCVDVHTPKEAAKAVRLRAGERLRYGQQTPPTLEQNINPDDIAVWARGELMLDNATVAEAVKAIARYRQGAVYVWGQTPQASRISGSFRLDRPDDALATIAATAGLHIIRLPGHIVVLRPA